jgi:hypothetical protein
VRIWGFFRCIYACEFGFNRCGIAENLNPINKRQENFSDTYIYAGNSDRVVDIARVYHERGSRLPLKNKQFSETTMKLFSLHLREELIGIARTHHSRGIETNLSIERTTQIARINWQYLFG